MSRAVPAIVCSLALTTVPAAAKTSSTPADAAKTKAETANLRAQTKKLRNDDKFWPGRAADYGAVLAAVGALIGLFVTASKNRSDRAEQAQKDADERDQERLRRFDEQFGKMVEGLTSDKAATRASSAAAITTFLRPEHAQFHDQVLALLIANLKFPRDDASDRIVARVFARALREHRTRLPNLLGGELDLNEATLRDADLSGLNLTGCDMTRADLRHANLSKTELFRSKGFQADLNAALLASARLGEARLNEATLTKARLGGARLVSAKLRGVHAVGTSFEGALLQDAHLHGADLRAATFRDANLNNAFFLGARFDESALASIVGAVHWRDANWDPDVFARLKVLAGDTDAAD